MKKILYICDRDKLRLMKKPWLRILLSKAGTWMIYSASVAIVVLTGACRSTKRLQKTDSQESLKDRDQKDYSSKTLDFRYFEGLAVPDERLLEIRVMYGVPPVERNQESLMEKADQPASAKAAARPTGTYRDSLRAERDSLRRTLNMTRNLVIYGPPEMIKKVGKELQEASDRVDSISRILGEEE